MNSLGYRSFGKRVLDIVAASFGLAAFGPFMILIALLVRIILGAPVLFCQKRPGVRGKPFVMYKFRTMNDLRNDRGEIFPDEQRLVPFSRFLRSISLDELPELINVLKGEMSIVGPRPLLMEYLDHYSPEQMRRHDVTPGITGWAQVNGRNAITWQKRFSLDVWYVDNVSFLLDIKIILMTIVAVISRRGVSQPGHVTIEKFSGNHKEAL